MIEPKICCEKCKCVNGWNGTCDECTDVTCPCHVPVSEPTPPPTEWEERLEKKFFDRDKMLRYLEGASMKDFIRTLLAEQKARMVEVVRNSIEDYFTNLIHIPNPPATKNALKEYIIKALSK